MNLPKEFDAAIIRERLASGCKTLQQLLVGLGEAQGKVATDVHAIRKLGKSLRGGFALFPLQKSSAHKIQAIGRLLSGRRDAVSRLHTWHRLAWNDDSLAAAAITGLLEQQTHSASHRPPPPATAWCLDHIADAQQALRAMPVAYPPAQITARLKRLQRKTLKRCGKLNHRADKDFHKARKALKAWLGAIGFLPEGMLPHAPLLDDMADLLGDENDLATFALWLDRHGFVPILIPALWQALHEARHQLQREIIRHARELPPSLA